MSLQEALADIHKKAALDKIQERVAHRERGEERKSEEKSASSSSTGSSQGVAGGIGTGSGPRESDQGLVVIQSGVFHGVHPRVLLHGIPNWMIIII